MNVQKSISRIARARGSRDQKVKNNSSDVFYDVTKINIEEFYEYIHCEFCPVKLKKIKNTVPI